MTGRTAGVTACGIGCAVAWSVASSAIATPRMALEAGSPCLTCHTSPQGGGVRNDVGWYSETGTGAWTPTGMPKSNALLDGRMWFGADIRMQLARLGRPSEAKPEPDREFFLMQGHGYVATAPSEWLILYGAVNGAAFDRRYPGQSHWEGALQFSPRPSLPLVRLGLIQPSIGIRPDDHTQLLRSNASDPRRPFIPPNYVEPGLEFSYHPISWFELEAGVFLNHYLTETVPGLSSAASWLFRLLFLPQILKWGLNTWVGVSGYGSRDFLMANFFLGIGIKGWITLLGEMAETHWEPGKKTDAWSATVGFTPRPWLHLNARAEAAYAAVRDRTYRTHQYVLGVHFVPLPFLQLRPEYRYVRTDAYLLAQYTLQVYAYF
jgi:hypothetical protein